MRLAQVADAQDLVEELAKPQWWIDRKGEVREGQLDAFQLRVLTYYKVSNPFDTAKNLYSGFENTEMWRRFNNCPFPLSEKFLSLEQTPSNIVLVNLMKAEAL